MMIEVCLHTGQSWDRQAAAELDGSGNGTVVDAAEASRGTSHLPGQSD